jgi:hypothetical protein
MMLLIVVAVFYGGVQYAQMYFYATAFDDFVKTEVKFAPTNDSADKDHLTEHILDASQDYGVDVAEQDIKINKVHNKEQNFDTLTVDVQYSAPVYLKIYTQQVQFHTTTSISY